MAVRKKRKPARRGRLFPAWAWLGLGIISGIGIAMSIDIDGWYAGKNRAVTQEAVKPAESLEKRKFDFYTLLPELEIIIPQDEITLQGEEPVKPARRPEHKGGYLLQAGSFKQFDEADSLKARLALLGIEAHIQSVEVNDITWHRVRIGPSNDRQALEETRKNLRTNQIDTILMQAKQ